MMVFECELELFDEYNGIIELFFGEVGQKFVDWLVENDLFKVDFVIEIVIMLNCFDVLGVCGVVLDFVVWGLGKMKFVKIVNVIGIFDSLIFVFIDEDICENGCFVFGGCLIKGVKNGLSFEWLQDCFKVIGLCLILILVDIINFFIYDCNCLLYVFDVDKVKGDLCIYCFKVGEIFVGLDEKEYIFGDGQVVIFDDVGIESIVGIMGGLEIGCIDEIVNVFFEVVYWDYIQIVIMGWVLKINLDVCYCNECGIDPGFNMEVLDLVMQMIMDFCGGELFNVVVVGEVFDVSCVYKLDIDCVQFLVGMIIFVEEQCVILEVFGFMLDGDMVIVLSWCFDVLGEVDLVEEVV